MAEEDHFDAATAYVQTLVGKGDLNDDILLKFYGYFKQATDGKCDIPKPGIFDLKGRKKWSAWDALGDMPSATARACYVDLLTSVKPDWLEEPRSSKGGAGGPVFSSLAHDSDDMAQLRSTQLIAACGEGHLLLVQHLLAEGAPVNERDSDGCAPLHWAADKGQCDIIAELLGAGADLNAVDVDGQSALHYAALAEQKDAALALLEAGIDRNIVNTDGETAEDVAPEDWRGLVFTKEM